MSSDHKLVPIEPTEKMIGAALDADDTCWNEGTPDWYAEKLFRAVWAAMIYAADPSETLAAEDLALDETSGSTRWAVERAKDMLSAGINIQAVGDSTNSVVTGVIKSLLDHIDELDADLKCAIAVGRLAARSSQRAVQIKLLQWRDHRPDSFPEPAWSAQTPFGFYNIEEVSASDSPAYVVRLHAHHFIADKDSLEEAKAAAQVDYERRIRSALQDSPCCKGLAPITECQCEQDRLAAPRVSELDLRVQIDDLTALNKKLTTDLTALALDWQERAEKASIALAAEQAINKDLKIELDEARADIEASISDFKVAGGKLSEAQDAVSELRAELADQRVFCEALERARSHFAVMTSNQAIRAMQEIEEVLARVADWQALVHQRPPCDTEHLPPNKKKPRQPEG